MRRAMIFGSSVAAILALTYLWPSFGGSSADNGGARGAMCIAGHCCCAGRAEAKTVAANAAQGRLTLDPNQFTGPVKQAYMVAEKNPALLAELHCYCGCDKADGHQNLLDCYRGLHGATCEICTEEALLAERMSEQRSPLDQIRDAIRRRFASDN
ncbi:CYCXC family (seleno)protein [Candidatus Binatus sp.]|uniref:CYCXC family (seleno)protein n=1 Tax=Candidatus Binatus sp. TaxID=2811406 RepID=UPI002F94EDCB